LKNQEILNTENKRQFFVFRFKRKIFIWFSILVIVLLVIFLITGFYSASQPVSYLPKNIPDFIDSLPSAEGQFLIKNEWYNIIVDQKGRIAVKGPDGKVIISALTYYLESEDGKNNWGLKNVFVNRVNDSSIQIKGDGIKNEQVQLSIIANKSIPKIDIQVETNYHINTIIKKEAIVASFNIPLSQVYRKNREMDTKNFQPEYWLQKEGVRFGDNKHSALIYHTPLISSLQLETEKKRLFINLDYALDHPFVKFPYQKDQRGRWQNLSASDFKNGSELKNSFSIYIGPIPKAIPRLMLVPFGYKAGYVFTEHADGGNIRTQRAAYFGSEDITNATQATGGFVQHKIPVTKSVFYTGSETSPGASIYQPDSVSPLLNFLDQIYATNLYDLCLHTPENGTSNRQILEESIKFMKERYNSVCWIDHGFYGGKLNREAFVCDGLDSSSPYYVADLWKKYNTKYFWSPAVEMINNSNWVSVSENIKRLNFYKAYVTFLRRYISPKDLKNLNIIEIIKKIRSNYSYRLEMNTLEYNSGPTLPTPLYWQNPTRTGEFYSWATNQEKGYGDLSENEVEKEKGQLSNLINHQGIFIDHGYFVRNRSDDRILKTINGKLVINPNFDKILSLIDERRKKGDIYVTTVRDLLNYWIMLEKVEFQYLPDGSINVINNNDNPIKGLSLIIRAKKVLVNGKLPAMKESNDDTIFWFDLGQHETVKITISAI
jgi:hypothetical protein